MHNKKERILKVQNVLKSFIKNFQINTFDYLYEEDIRAELFFLLKEAFQENFLIDNISRVKTEYHYLPDHKIDISILGDFRNLKPTFETEKKIFELYKQKAEIGIEIKFQSIGYDQIGTFRRDIDKLYTLVCSEEKMESIDTGIALLFFQIQKDFEKVRDHFSEYSNREFLIRPNCVNQIIISPCNVLFNSTS